MALMAAKLLAGYLCVINITAFITMAADKRKAVKGKWRIPERVLFGTAILGGSVGAIAGMYVFRHKTRHRTFTIGLPVILLLQLAAAGYLLFVFG